MTFNIQNFYRASPSFPVVQNADGSVSRQVGEWYYNSLVDSAGTITASGYFNPVAELLDVSQVIQIVDSSGEFGFYNVVSVTSGVVTIAGVATIGMGGVGPSQLGAVAGAGIGGGSGAVLTAHTDNVTLDTNGSGSSIEIIPGAVGSTQLSVLVEKTLTGTISAASFIGMYATPIQILAALGTHKAIIPKSFALELVYGTTQYTAGGVIALQFGSTVHGGGTLCSATLAANVITGASAGIIEVLGGAVAGASSAIVNANLYLSNQTAAFATGDSTFNWSLKYYELVTSA